MACGNARREICEPARRKPRLAKELGLEQVHILLPWPGHCQHGEQFVMLAVKGPLAEVRRLPG